jgi:hypothetical protein
MSHAKFSTDGTTWITATFTTTVSGNFVDFENKNYYWGALTDTGEIWKNYQGADNLGSFSLSSSYPSDVKQLSTINNNFIAVLDSGYQESNNLESWINFSLIWTTVNSNFGNTVIFSIAYGNGLWVASGDAGQIRTSTNGSTWTTVTSNFSNDFFGSIRSISYGNDLWVAGGQLGQIRTSTNGSTWTTVTSNFGSTLIQSIAYGNGLWVAGGYTGQMRTSTNGSTWTTVNSNFGTSIINSIAYDNGLWVAGGYTGQMRTSTNGSTWTTVNSNFGNTNIRSIAYGSGLWVAGGFSGQVRASTNGSTWTTVTSNFGNTTIRSIAYANGLWVAGGQLGQIRTSTNGSTWTTVTSNFGNAQINSIAYGNGLWVAGGAGVSGEIRTSTNPGEQQNLNKFIKSQDEQKAAFLNNDGILFNWNGVGYDKISTGINDNFVNGAIRNNGGTYEYIIQGNNAMYYSTNLTTWTTISVPPSSDVNDIIAK